MSSIGGFSSTSSTTMIDYLGPNRYRVMDQRDKDGDGVSDGKSLTGEQGKVVNESVVNQMLAARGLQAANGEFRSVDNFAVSSSNVGAVASFGGDPPLPDVSGAATRPGVLSSRIDWMESSAATSDAALMWMALSTLAHTAMRDMKDAKSIKNALQKSKVELQKQEISTTEQRIAAEGSAASMSFGFAVAGAVVSGVMGSGAVGQTAANMSQGVSNAVSKFGDYLNKTSGPQAEADYQQIREKVLQQQQSLMDMSIEDTKSKYDDTKELFKLALKIMSEHVERQSQVVQSISRG